MMIMNNEHEWTYALLVRSEEKSRSIMEIVVYGLFALSVLVSIFQFIQQPNPLPINQLTISGHHQSPVPPQKA
jgi:hypothetical protein